MNKWMTRQRMTNELNPDARLKEERIVIEVVDDFAVVVVDWDFGVEYYSCC